MSKISPDGFVKTDIFNDFSIFNFNNTIIGQYSAKINKGSNNVIIGNNAGKIGLSLNNSTIIGANAGGELFNSDKVISIGNENSSVRDLKEIINIGNFGKLENSNTIHIDNYNNPVNKILDTFNSQFAVSLSNSIYLGIGNYKDIPIIISSKRNIDTSSQFFIDGSINTEIIKIRENNTSISFKYTDNYNIIYNLPSIPNYENAYLTVDKFGNLEWLEITENLIKFIISSADIICENLDTNEITGNGLLISNLNISKFTTDDLKEGLLNIYFKTSLVNNIFYNYLKLITSDLISGNYYNDDKYKINFYSNLQLITTDNINSSNSNLYYSYNDYYSNSLSYFNSINRLKEGTSNLYFNSNLVKINFDIIAEGTSNLYFNSNNYEYLIRSNLKTTDFIKQGQSNLYNYNCNISFELNTDFIKQGTSNLYTNEYTIYNYLNSNFPTTDKIKTGTSNYFFNNISNFDINTDKIREGSNKYLNNSNQIIGIIQFNTTTDLYNQGSSNFYYDERKGIEDFKKIAINSNIIDVIKEGKNKFIKNNFYNNNLVVNGFLKSSNINDIDKQLLTASLEPNIGPNTDVIQSYNFNNIYFNERLSNIELKYNFENTNIEIPFIVIDNKVGICNPNPRYQLDVNGSINSSNLLINNINVSNLYINSNYYLSNAKLILNSQNIYSNNGKFGIGTNNPQSFLHLAKTDSIIPEDVRIKITDISTTNGFEIIKDFTNKCYIWNNENTDLIIGTNNIQRLLVKNNSFVYPFPYASSGFSITNNFNRKIELLTLGGGEFYGNIANGDRTVPFITIYDRIDVNNFNTAIKIETAGLAFNGRNSSTSILMDSGDNINSPSIIKFATLNTDRLFIYNENIGIGVSVPNYKLDINGDINLIGNIRKNGLILPQWINNSSSLYYNDGNVGIGTSTPSLKLSVIGSINATETITSGFSDIRLKKIHSNIENPFEIIDNLKGFYYTPNELAKNLGILRNQKEIGLNAQEVLKVLPEIVEIAPFDLDINKKSKSGENYLTISYERLVPVLLEGIKELKKEIENLKQKISNNK
jgi:hypothetical protein